MSTSFRIGDHAVGITGRLIRIVHLRDEYYDFVRNPPALLNVLRTRVRGTHLFTFVQSVADRSPQHGYYFERESAAVLELSTYETWWNRQISHKTRNMVRKAQKCGVKIGVEELSDELVDGIMQIYNETPIRQGRLFRHFGKPFETVKAEHATFLDRSEFICAYHEKELIGFIKLVHGQGVSNLMQIIAKMSHRDKAVTDALIAKAVERCTTDGVPLLHYGLWSRGSMGRFKRNHGFERIGVPRYFVPLNLVGDALLRCGLHRSLKSRLPELWLNQLATLRSKYNTFRYSRQSPAARR